MYLLYCDESNLERRQGDFFVYGGISVPDLTALSLSKEIDAIRASFKVDPQYLLKFNPGPEGMDHNQFIALKQQVIECSVKHGVQMFTSLILHDVATSPDDARINEINRVCYNFDCYLSNRRSHGLVLIDRFDDGTVNDHLIEKFSVGVVGLPFTPVKRLANIVGFHYSNIGQSNYTSIVDVAIGSLRYCINGFTRGDSRAVSTAGKVLPILSPLFHRHDGRQSVSDLGMCFSPKDVRTPKYKLMYDNLRVFLNDNQITTTG